jgi:ATP-binding cassette subfamily B protein
MIAFGWVTNLVQRGRASWGRLLQVLETPPSIDDAAVTHPDVRPQDLSGAIELRHLSFSFGDRRVLDDVSVSVPAGRTVAVVGHTGSGKSTLMALLARLHDPPPGTVLVDGLDVRQIPLASLRGAIGFVPQEPFLFSDTLAENVAFGGDGTPDSAPGTGGAPDSSRPDRIVSAARIARLDKDVADFPDGYQTRIGERGITLSGGQKQRTAIARALYVNPRILILDDALSAVDTHTEEEILHGLREFRQGRTSFVVSHRISTVRDADLILVLDRGRVVERGRHEDLVAADGTYAELYRLQLLEEELQAS